jgi:gliding motility-associated-like protein
MKKRLFPAIIIGCWAQLMAAQIQISFNLVSPGCHGATNGSITAQAVGGTGSYTYLWNNGTTQQSLGGIGAGTYTVTVTDDAQQSASETVELTQPSDISPAITAQNINCDGNNGTLTASAFGGIAPYQYSWGGPNNSSSETVTVIAPGTYTVTITDANQCTGAASYVVSAGLSLTVSAIDIACADDPNSGKVTTQISGGMSPFSYQWSNGATTQTLENVGAGQYFCTVTGANGCLITAQDIVDIPPALTLETIWLTPACGGINNGSATVAVNGGVPPYQITWNPGGLLGPAQTGLAAGTYSVVALDANQCQKEIEISVQGTNSLDVQLVVRSATCLGVNDAEATAVVQPAGSGYVYQWNILPPDSNVTQVTGLSAGAVISVTVTDPVSGCSGTATGIVGAHSNLNVLVTDVDIPCAGGLGSALAEASNGTPQYQYTWLNGNGQVIGNEAAIDSLTPGAYQVNVVDSLGCTGSGVADIGIVSAPNAVIDGDSVLVCGDSLSVVQFTNLSFDQFNQIVSLQWTVTGPSVDTIIINENQVIFQLPVDETILVQLVATSSTGCKDTAWLTYNVPGYPLIELSLDSTSFNCTQDPVQINVIGGDSTYTYVWTPSVTFNPNPLHVLVSPTVTTTYTLVTTDGNACTTVDSISVPPLDSLFQLMVGDTLIESCEDSVKLFATTNVTSSIQWSQGNTVLTGNPVWVPATPVLTYYTATAITADSCVLTQKVGVIGQGIEISIDSLAPSSICEGDTLPLSVVVAPADAVVDYQWSVPAPAILLQPNSATPLITGPAGEYLVTVVATRAFCSDTLSFTITILPGDSLDGAITADLCRGLTVSFTNDSEISGLWDFGDGTPKSSEINPVHTYPTPGMYMVVFTPNAQFNCVAPWDSMIMVVEDTLKAYIAHAYEDCAVDAQIQFSGTATHDAIATWNWQFSNGSPVASEVQNPLITYVEEGIYLATLTVIDSNNCVATAIDTVQVDIIADQISDNTLICLFDSLELNPIGIDTAADYTWTSVPADPSLNPNDPNPVVMPLAPVVYSVEISKGLCTVNYSMAVSFAGSDTVRLAMDTMVVCSMDSVTITALTNGQTDVEWSNSPFFTNIFATTKAVTVAPGSIYYVRTANVECPSMDSMRTDIQIPEIQVIPSDDNICAGEEATLILTNLISEHNLTYDWTPELPGIANPIVSPLETTTYTVLVTNQFGCTTSLSYTIEVTNVTVTATTEHDTLTLINPGTVLTATPGGNGVVVQYEWTPSGTLSNPNAPQTEATPTESTTYIITVTTEDGCVARDTVEVVFRYNACIEPFVFIPKAFTPNNDNKNDLFKVHADGMTELNLIIWNRWGEVVFETNDPGTLGWDGSYRGREAVGDSFAWYVKLRCGNGEYYENKGNVTLLK